MRVLDSDPVSVFRLRWFLFILASQLSGEIVAKDDREEDVQIKDKNVTRT